MNMRYMSASGCIVAAGLITVISVIYCMMGIKVYAASEDAGRAGEAASSVSDISEAPEVTYEADPELEKRIEDSMSEESFKNELRITDEDMADALESAENQVYAVRPFKISYDASTGLYRYYWSEKDGVRISVPNGSMATEAVTVIVDEDTQLLSMSKDGVSVIDEDNDKKEFILRESGSYAFMLRIADGGGDYRFIGAFTILDAALPVTKDCITTPEGYMIDDVIYNGNSIRIDNLSYYIPENDGRYEIDYRPLTPGSSLPYRSFTFIRDTTAPMITFEGDIKNGVFTTDVTYRVSDPYAELEIYYDGTPAYSPNNTLAAAGNYYIKVKDMAGNMRTYSLIVQRHGYIPWEAVVVALLVFIVISVIVVLTSQKGMRVK